jgi:hypothetical protein
LGVLIFVVFCIDLIDLASSQPSTNGHHQLIGREFRDSTKVVSQFLDNYTSRYKLSKFSSELNYKSITTLLEKENPFPRRGLHQTAHLGSHATQTREAAQDAMAHACAAHTCGQRSSACEREAAHAGKPARAGAFCINALASVGNPATPKSTIPLVST